MLNKYKGCLLGLAVGDALGAAVEFMSYAEIKRKYVEDGIQDFDGWGGFEAGSYTDYTQMALATAIRCIEDLAEKMYRIFKEQPSESILSLNIFGNNTGYHPYGPYIYFSFPRPF